MAKIFVDNTSIVRLSDARITTITGASSLATEPGTYTVRDVNGVAVPGQTWPAALTMNSPGEYAGFIDADVQFVIGNTYTIEVVLGSGDRRTGKWTATLTPAKRKF